jgi:hypothetical protein
MECTEEKDLIKLTTREELVLRERLKLENSTKLTHITNSVLGNSLSSLLLAQKLRVLHALRLSY